jgi:hypothetical protein
MQEGEMDDPTRPAPGTPVSRGQEIVVPVPAAVEADEIHAWFGGAERSATLAPDGRTLTVRVPGTVTGSTVLTIYMSTREVPVAFAYWYPVIILEATPGD